MSHDENWNEDWAKHQTAASDLGADPAPKSRNEAAPYISHKSLMATGRAVRRERQTLVRGTAEQVVYDLLLTFAGDADDLKRDNMGRRTHRIRYKTNRAAKSGQAMFVTELRKAATDFQHNQILLAILTRLRIEQLPKTYRHLHACSLEGTGNEQSCVFPWAAHEIGETVHECDCGAVVDDVPMDGQFPVIHYHRIGETCA